MNLLPKYKIIFVPLASIATLIGVAVLFIGVFVNRLTAMKSELEQLQVVKKSLETKRSILKSSSSIDASSLSDEVTFAVPYKNPGIFLLSQINKKSKENNLVVENLSMSGQSEEMEGIFSSQVTFILSGELKDVNNFLNSIINSVPLSKIDQLQIKVDTQGLLSASVSMKIFWADLPTKLPSVERPITDLTPQEKEILEKLTQLDKPDLIELKPQEASPSTRLNPFSEL